MKRDIISMLFVAAALVSSCSDSNDEAEVSNDSLSLSPSTEYVVGPDAEQISVTVTSSDDWILSGIYDWVTPSISSGSSGATVTFTVEENTSDDARQATFKFFTGSYVEVVTISSQPLVTFSLLSDNLQSLTTAATTLSILLESNASGITQAISEDAQEWISFYAIASSLGSQKVVTYNVAENVGFEPRSGELTISLEGEDDIVIDVEQAQVNSIQIEETSLTYDLASRTIELSIDANVDYAVASTADWAVVSNQPRALTSSDVGLVNQTISISLAAVTSSCSGTITLTSDDHSTITITIIRLDPNATEYNFTDANLVTKLSSLGHILPTGDNSGVLLVDPATVTSLNLASSSLTSLDGLEIFTALETLTCSSNYLDEIDLTGFTTISSLSPSGNSLSSIKTGSNPVTSIAITYLTDAGAYSTSTISKYLKVEGDNIQTVTINGTYALYGNSLVLDCSLCPALTSLTGYYSSGRTTYYAGEVILSTEDHQNVSLTVGSATTITYVSTAN